VSVAPIPILAATMLVVAAALASTIWFFEVSTRRVSRETAAMLSNGVPSVDQLNRVRAALRHIDATFDFELLEMLEERPVDRTLLMKARDRFKEELAAYRLLPYYEFEDALNRDLDRELDRLYEAIQRLANEMETGNVERSMQLENGAWRRQSDAVDDRLRALIAFNNRHLTEHALRIDRIRQRSALVGFGVGVAALLVALAATVVAALAVRRRMRLQTERAAELEMFSSRVAHDLMSPLTSVALAIELGKTEAHSDSLSRYLDRALASAKRMRGIVDGLLDFARSGGQPPTGARGELIPVVQAVVDESRPRAAEERIELNSAELAGGEVACSPGILAVILTNLVNNAIKFMGDASRRRITVRACDRGGDTVRVEVADTGPGLPAGFERQAFEPYARANTRVPGLGIGLATVKRLVSAHGGRVGVTRGQDGVGALFWFELPRPTPAAG
jgi:signal transduction histidine kinase